MGCQPTEIVDDRSFRDRVLEARHATLVLFTSRACLPCDVLARRLPGITADLAGALEVVCCPTERSPGIVRRYNVTRTPTLFLFADGGLIAARTGPAPLPVIGRWIVDALGGRLDTQTAADRPTGEDRTPGATVRAFLLQMISRATVLRACGVASVVAPALLLVNHADLLLSHPVSYPVLRKLALNFAVPYLVSSYSSALAAIRWAATDRGAAPRAKEAAPPGGHDLDAAGTHHAG
jgi:thioredoxin 1